MPSGEALKHGQVGGVLLLLLEGELQFSGDPHKGRDAGVWRSAAFGELYARHRSVRTTAPRRHARCPRLRAARRRRSPTPSSAPETWSPSAGRATKACWRCCTRRRREESAGALKLMGGSGRRCGVRSLVRPCVAHRTPAAVRSTAYASRGRAAADARSACRASSGRCASWRSQWATAATTSAQRPYPASHDGIRAMMLCMPWCRASPSRSSTRSVCLSRARRAPPPQARSCVDAPCSYVPPANRGSLRLQAAAALGGRGPHRGAPPASPHHRAGARCLPPSPALLLQGGMMSPGLHLIVSGSVRVSKRVGPRSARDSLICHAESGDVLGERSLVSGEPSMASVRG